MNYNDIIIILLLVIIIGLVLFKNDNTYFTKSERIENIMPPDNYMTQNYASINTQHNNQFKKLNYQQYNPQLANYPNPNVNINKYLNNIKKNKNKSSVIIKHNLDNKNDINNNNDLGSLDDISLNKNNVREKKHDIKKPSINVLKNKKNLQPIEKKKAEEINKKVIIDDYSEFDNIKSLNSMDNTLSDVISIVERD